MTIRTRGARGPATTCLKKCSSLRSQRWSHKYLGTKKSGMSSTISNSRTRKLPLLSKKISSSSRSSLSKLRSSRRSHQSSSFPWSWPRAQPSPCTAREGNRASENLRLSILKGIVPSQSPHREAHRSIKDGRGT